MKTILRYTHRATDDLKRLPKKIAGRIIQKMDWFARQKDPLAFAKYIGREEGAIYRFRIGNYRIFCETSGKTTRILMILSIKNRKDAYK